MTTRAVDEIIIKADRLLRTTDRGDMDRIRAIVDGGERGLRAMLGEAGRELGQDLPAPNMILSGMERHAQKVGRIPVLKVPPIINRGKDADVARQRADKIDRIVTGLDLHQRLPLQMPKQGRWLPLYGYAVWVLRPKSDGTYVGEVRDPFDVYPGYWTTDHPPTELAVRRIMDVAALKAIYPELDMEVGEAYDQTTEVVEYYDKRGTWVIARETKQVLDFIESLLDEPMFVFGARPTGGTLQGQYDQVIGLLGMMVRLNVLALMSVQDDVNAPVDIIGDIESGQYKRGRFSVNKFTPGTQIQRGRQSNVFPAFEQINRLERQLRIAAGYGLQDDSISPNSFVTGAGLQELDSAGVRSVREYHTVFKYMLEELDTKRLKLNQTVWGDTERLIVSVNEKGSPFVETYVPNEDINGHYLTTRTFGVMASWDDPTKIVTGLQLLQAGAIDLQTFQENLDNLEDVGEIRNRNRSDQAENSLLASLDAAASQGDLNAAAQLNEIRKRPEKMSDILDEFFAAPEQPEVPPGVAAGQAPPDVTTVLSRLTQGGEAQGGVQTVGQF